MTTYFNLVARFIENEPTNIAALLATSSGVRACALPRCFPVSSATNDTARESQGALMAMLMESSLMVFVPRLSIFTWRQLAAWSTALDKYGHVAWSLQELTIRLPSDSVAPDIVAGFLERVPKWPLPWLQALSVTLCSFTPHCWRDLLRDLSDALARSLRSLHLHFKPVEFSHLGVAYREPAGADGLHDDDGADNSNSALLPLLRLRQLRSLQCTELSVSLPRGLAKSLPHLRELVLSGHGGDPGPAVSGCTTLTRFWLHTAAYGSGSAAERCAIKFLAHPQEVVSKTLRSLTLQQWNGRHFASAEEAADDIRVRETMAALSGCTELSELSLLHVNYFFLPCPELHASLSMLQHFTYKHAHREIPVRETLLTDLVAAMPRLVSLDLDLADQTSSVLRLCRALSGLRFLRRLALACCTLVEDESQQQQQRQDLERSDAAAAAADAGGAAVFRRGFAALSSLSLSGVTVEVSRLFASLGHLPRLEDLSLNGVRSLPLPSDAASAAAAGSSTQDAEPPSSQRAYFPMLLTAKILALPPLADVAFMLGNAPRLSECSIRLALQGHSSPAEPLITTLDLSRVRLSAGVTTLDLGGTCSALPILSPRNTGLLLLDVRDCAALTPTVEQLRGLASCPSLLRVDFSHTGLATIAPLANGCPALTHLVLRHCKRLDGVAGLETLPRLKCLNLMSCVTVPSIKCLSHSRSLEILILLHVGCKDVDEFAALEGISTLCAISVNDIIRRELRKRLWSKANCF